MTTYFHNSKLQLFSITLLQHIADLTFMKVISFCTATLVCVDNSIGYEPADLTVHPPPKQSRVGSFFSHRCLVPPKFFPQRKRGFYRRYSH